MGGKSLMSNKSKVALFVSNSFTAKLVLNMKLF